MADNSGSLSKLDAAQILRLSYDNEQNRLRTAATIVASIADLDVHIDAAAGDNISIASADGSNPMAVNSDGSINAKITDLELNQASDSIAIGDGNTLAYIDPTTRALLVSLDSTALTTKNLFDEVPGVVSGVTTEVITYTAVANTKLLRLDFGGENVAQYTLLIGGTTQAKKYTYYTNLNESLEFVDGLPITSGSIVTLEVIHTRPDPGLFYCNMVIEN